MPIEGQTRDSSDMLKNLVSDQEATEKAFCSMRWEKYGFAPTPWFECQSSLL